MTVDAGELRERIEVLELQRTEKAYRWQPVRKSWAKAVLSNKRNHFSVHGIGAAGVTFTIRCQNLTLGHAFQHNGQHCFITGIFPEGRQHLRVEAALVVISQCEDKYTDTTFPGIVTEEYHRHDQLEPQAVNTLRHVLVTPKDILLTPGRLVDVDGVAWPILTAHLLDPWKNEYIIEKVVDL